MFCVTRLGQMATSRLMLSTWFVSVAVLFLVFKGEGGRYVCSGGLIPRAWYVDIRRGPTRVSDVRGAFVVGRHNF